jgi:hypothetical protein
MRRSLNPRGHLVVEAAKLTVEDTALDPGPHDGVGRAVPKPWVSVSQSGGQFCGQRGQVHVRWQLEVGVCDCLPVSHGMPLLPACWRAGAGPDVACSL